MCITKTDKRLKLTYGRAPSHECGLNSWGRTASSEWENEKSSHIPSRSWWGRGSSPTLTRRCLRYRDRTECHPESDRKCFLQEWSECTRSYLLPRRMLMPRLPLITVQSFRDCAASKESISFPSHTLSHKPSQALQNILQGEETVLIQDQH